MYIEEKNPMVHYFFLEISNASFESYLKCQYVIDIGTDLHHTCYNGKHALSGTKFRHNATYIQCACRHMLKVHLPLRVQQRVLTGYEYNILSPYSYLYVECVYYN